jgi:hypothetical protein
MADITTIETVILEMIDEDLTTPDNWDGTDEVREWVADGLDELCAIGKFYRRKLEIGLEGGVSVYSFSPTREVVVDVKSMWLRNKQRPLEQTSLRRLARQDPRWLSTSGPPFEYFIMDFEQFGIYPRYDDDEDSVEIDVVMIPEPYVGSTGMIGAHSDYEEGLVSYAKHMLYVRLGRVESAMAEYQEFLTLAGAGKMFQQQLAAVKDRRKHGIGE